MENIGKPSLKIITWRGAETGLIEGGHEKNGVITVEKIVETRPKCMKPGNRLTNYPRSWTTNWWDQRPWLPGLPLKKSGSSK